MMKNVNQKLKKERNGSKGTLLKLCKTSVKCMTSLLCLVNPNANLTKNEQLVVMKLAMRDHDSFINDAKTFQGLLEKACNKTFD